MNCCSRQKARCVDRVASHISTCAWIAGQKPVLGQQSRSPSLCLIFTRRLLSRDRDRRRNWPHTERRQKVSEAKSKKSVRSALQNAVGRGVLGRWRTAAIDRTTFHVCQQCRKTTVFAVFSRLWGVIWRGKALRDKQWQFLTRNKSLSSENDQTVR